MRRWTGAGAVAVVVVLTACRTGDAPLASARASTTASAPAPTSARPTPDAPPAADVVRATGAPLPGPAPVAGALLPAADAAVETSDAGDGSTVATVTGHAGPLAWVAPPAGGRAEVQADGSVTLHDAAGTVVAALAVPTGADGARGAWHPVGDVLGLEAPGGSASFVAGAAALDSATWGEAEGGRSLAVVPAAWVRGGSLAAQQAVASQLAAAEPEAASASMQAQLWCHVLGAPDKASWNLEPWRPEVSTTTLLTSRCNPTDADL